MDAATDWVVSGGRYALDFDGTNDFVEVPFLFNGTGAITLWFRAAAELAGTAIYLGNKSNIGTQIYLGQNVTGSLTNELISFSNDVGVTSRIYGYTTPTRTELYDGNWHHICVGVRQANSAPEIYLDGNSKSVTLGTATLSSWSIGSASGTVLQFGCQNFSGANSFFLTGQMDDVRFYNRALSPAEIRTLATRRGIAYERRKRRSVFFDAAFFNPAWARNSNVILSPVGAA